MADPGLAEERSTKKELLDKGWFQFLLIVVGVALYFLIGLGLWWVLDHQYIKPTDAGDKSRLVQALSLIMAGVAGAVGIYFTWRDHRLARKTQKENQEATYQGQITERFTAAINQLGNEKTEVRIGGIYALESIAKESKEHYWPIIEILASYLQTRAKPSLVCEEISKFSGEEDDDDRRHQHPFPDAQAALYVLARRDHSLDPKDGRFINLSSTDLRNADLRRANLNGARLRQVNLEGAILRDVLFEEAVLSEAHLENTKLERAIFTKANLRKAIFTKANLKETDLSNAYLKKADLTIANLTGANLRGAYKKKGSDDEPRQMITNEELDQQAYSLEGATMPNGQKYEDWLKERRNRGDFLTDREKSYLQRYEDRHKDKKGRREDGENSGP